LLFDITRYPKEDISTFKMGCELISFIIGRPGMFYSDSTNTTSSQPTASPAILGWNHDSFDNHGSPVDVAEITWA
jgi:hypothetical protein